jgi:lysophospholipase L1-like esterase
VRQLDAGAILTPDGYRDSMPVDGVDTVVREPDGMHLNEAGAQVLAKAIAAQLVADFTLPDA